MKLWRRMNVQKIVKYYLSNSLTYSLPCSVSKIKLQRFQIHIPQSYNGHLNWSIAFLIQVSFFLILSVNLPASSSNDLTLIRK